MFMPADAVFEGGGVKGIGLVGALAAAEQRGYRWRYVAGTSAGAIVASLVAAGYTAEEIRGIMYKTDFTKFIDKDLVSSIPIIGSIINVNLYKGIYKGNYFTEWIRQLLARKGVYKFKHLRVPGVQDEKFTYKLRVIATDLSREEMLVLPQDIAKYGLNPDELDVAYAIRMSMSIPFFYQPVKLEYSAHLQKLNSYIVDGAILSNFPVWLFDRKLNNLCCPTFGFRLNAPVYGNENRISGPLTMLKALFSTMMEAHDQKYIADAHFARSILIPTLGVRTTEFHISQEKQRALYKAGFKAAENFFEQWDYQKFVQKYNIE